MKIEKISYNELDKIIKQTPVGEEVKHESCVYYRIYNKSNNKDFWIFKDENNRLMINVVKPDILKNKKLTLLIFEKLKEDFDYIELHIPEYLNETYSLAISYGFKYKNSHEIITAKKEIIKISVLKKDLQNQS